MSNLFEMLMSNLVVSSVLAVVVVVISRWIRRPAVTHCLWLIVLLKLITPPIVPIRIAIPETSGPTPIGAFGTQETSRLPQIPLNAGTPKGISGPQLEFQDSPTGTSPAEYSGADAKVAGTNANIGALMANAHSPVEQTSGILPPMLIPVIMYVWLASSFAVLCITCVRCYGFSRLLDSAKPAPSGLQRETERLAKLIGLRRCPRVLLISANLSPMVWATFGRPQLLFPEKLHGNLHAEALRSLLLHELSHLRRGDHWIRFLELCVTVLYWWYPVLWWVRRELREAEEQCCDSWVVSELPDARADYATGLVQTVGFLSQSRMGLPVAASGIGGFIQLDRRVRMIMTETHPRRLSTRVRGALMLLGVSCLTAFPVTAVRTLPAEEAANEQQAGVNNKPVATTSNVDTSDQSTQKTNGRIRGRVVGPDGRGVDSARIWVAGPPRKPQAWSRLPQRVKWTELSQSGEDGRFDAYVDQSPFQDAAAHDRHVTVRVAATADGFGWAWADVRVRALNEEIALQLVKDVPINGRVLTTDGKPATGVTVAVNHISVLTGTLDDVKNAAPSSSGVYMNTPAWNGGGPIFESVVTDSDGRFRIEGMGANRHVRLQTVGGDIAATRLKVITIPTPENFQPSGAIAVREGIAESTYLASFTHLGAPGRTLRGQVTDAETGYPIPGVRLSSLASWHAWTHPVMTDSDGRYEIKGVPKADKYRLEFETTKSRHFNRGVIVADSDGLHPIEVDVALAKGVLVNGRVTDAESRQAVSGTVSYAPLYGNENVVTRDNLAYAELSSTRIAEDGSYAISVLPGPGVIAVKAASDQYISARVAPDRLRELGARDVSLDDYGMVSFIHVSSGPQSGRHISSQFKQAIEPINPRDEQPFRVDLQVVTGKTRRGTIVDETGAPLVGAKIIGYGVSAALSRGYSLETADFTVTKLAPGRKRSLLIVHRERELGARVEVSGDDPAPLTVRMQPTGRITGRFVDKLGEADLQGGQVLLGSEDLKITSVASAMVDADGRFEVLGLIEGCSYHLKALLPEGGVPKFVIGDIKVSSADTEDLGTFTKKDEYQFRQVDEKRTGGKSE